MNLQLFSQQANHNDFDIQYHLVKQFFSQPRSDQSFVDEISVMIEQNKILKNIKEEIAVSKKSDKRILTQEDLNESINMSSSCLIFRPTLNKPIKRTSDHSIFWEVKGDKVSTNTTLDDDIRIRRGTNSRIISEVEVEKALNDVQDKCDPATIQVIKHLINRSSQITKKLRENEDTIEALEKNKKVGQQLKLHQMDYERKILDYENRIRGLQLENTSLKENNQSSRRYHTDVSNEKEKQLSKMEIAIAFKQKLIVQDIKKVNNKLNLLKKQEAFVLENRKAAEDIWESIVNNLESPGDEFKGNIYNKCKESLMTQRKHLQQEQSHLDSQHEYIERIIAQLQTVL